jgi:hypothetical protein
MKTITKSLVGILAAFSISCAGTNRREDNLTREHYTLDFDIVPLEVAFLLYASEHNGQMPQSMQEISPYMMSPDDMNSNGVLDYHREVDVTRRGSTVIGASERTVTRQQASRTGRSEESQMAFTRNSDGTYTRVQRDTAVELNEEALDSVLAEYENGSYQQRMEHVRELLRRQHQNP